MLETYMDSPVTRKRLRSSPAADHIDAFADWLHSQGYRRSSMITLLRSLAGWTDWMAARGFTAQDFIGGYELCKRIVAKKRRVHYQRGPNRHSVAAAAVFLRFLQHQGVLPLPAKPLSRSELWPTLGEFRSWMSKHRGLTENTLNLYEGVIVGLLDALGDDPRTYSAEALRTFVLDRARLHSIHRAKAIVVAVRSYLRYLGVMGQCQSGMEHAIPGFASWQLSSVPRFLPAEDVER